MFVPPRLFVCLFREQYARACVRAAYWRCSACLLHIGEARVGFSQRRLFCASVRRQGSRLGLCEGSTPPVGAMRCPGGPFPGSPIFLTALSAAPIPGKDPAAWRAAALPPTEECGTAARPIVSRPAVGMRQVSRYLQRAPSRFNRPSFKTETFADCPPATGMTRPERP